MTGDALVKCLQLKGFTLFMFFIAIFITSLFGCMTVSCKLSLTLNIRETEFCGVLYTSRETNRQGYAFLWNLPSLDKVDMARFTPATLSLNLGQLRYVQRITTGAEFLASHQSISVQRYAAKIQEACLIRLSTVLLGNLSESFQMWRLVALGVVFGMYNRI